MNIDKFLTSLAVFVLIFALVSVVLKSCSDNEQAENNSFIVERFKVATVEDRIFNERAKETNYTKKTPQM